jgi:hypothetical protein
VIKLKAQLQEERTQHHVAGDSIEVQNPPNITACLSCPGCVCDLYMPLCVWLVHTACPFMSCCMMTPSPPLHVCVYVSGAS